MCISMQKWHHDCRLIIVAQGLQHVLSGNLWTNSQYLLISD